MKNLMLELDKIPLSKEESLKVEKIQKTAEEKYSLDPRKSENLRTLIENLWKNFKVLKESNAAIVSSDIDIFRDVAIIATTKAYTSSIIDQIASVQPLTGPFGYVYYLDFKYADDLASEGIDAGDSLSEKRSKRYSRVAEQQPARRIKAELRQDIINTEVRALEMSYTLQAFLNLSSVYGQDEARNFLDKRYLDVIQAKLKDEMELLVISALWDAVPSEHEVVYTVDSTDASDCVNKECHARNLYRAIDKAAQIVYDKYKVMPNTIIIGTDALNILRQGDVNITVIGNENLPTGIARNYVGILENKYKVIYDPGIQGVLLLWKDTASDAGSTVVYAPYIPLGITAPITERDLTTYRVVYTVDGYKVVHPEFTARVRLV